MYSLFDHASQVDLGEKNTVIWSILFESFFNVRILYAFIKFHKSFDFLIEELSNFVQSDETNISFEDRDQINTLKNMLQLISQTIKNEGLNFNNFCT